MTALKSLLILDIIYFSGGNYPIKGQGHEVFDPDNSNGRKNQLVFSRSMDAGVTWSPLQVVGQFPPNNVQGHFQLLALPATTQHPQGILMGIYGLYYNILTKATSPSNKDTIQMIQSFDRGQTWTSPKVISDIVHSSLPLDAPFEASTSLTFNEAGGGFTFISL